MVKGTQAGSVIEILRKISKRIRAKVREVTLDMAANMGLIVSRCFPKASKVIDRFHVQKLAFDAVQEISIQHRWQAEPRRLWIKKVRLLRLPGNPAWFISLRFLTMEIH